MAISNVGIQSSEQVSLSHSESSSRSLSVEKSDDGAPVVSAREERRRETNTMILQANYTTSLGNKNDASAMMFKSVIEEINKELEPTLGKNAAQKAYNEGIDFSPQATADRIVSFATQFFPLYQQQHKDDSLENQLDNFLGVVGGGVEKGFGEAKDILTGLNVFNGEIEKNANETHDLIYSGFDRFKESVLEAAKPKPVEAETAS